MNEMEHVKNLNLAGVVFALFAVITWERVSVLVCDISMVACLERKVFMCWVVPGGIDRRYSHKSAGTLC